MRVTADDLATLRRIERYNANQPRLSQEDLDEQIRRFLAVGGKIQHIPTGVSGEVIEYKPKVRREDKRVKVRVCDSLDLADTVGTDYLAKLLGISLTGVRELLRKEKVPHFRYGRRLVFKKAEIEEWAEKRKQQPMHVWRKKPFKAG